MRPARIILSSTAGLVCALVVVLILVAAAFVVAISGGHSVSVPGLVSVRAGEGSELASAQLAGPAVLAWIGGIGVVMSVAFIAASGVQERRRAPHAD